MALRVYWQSEVRGEQVRQDLSLFGQGFALTMVDDVVVDSTWLPATACFHYGRSAWADAIERCQLNHADECFEIKLLAQGTAYSRAVWLALTEIPLGRVLTYSELADQLNSGPRAVALACRNNPYPGIIPCHRVVSKSGIGGFMGQSQGPWVELKRQLLLYERNMA